MVEPVNRMSSRNSIEARAGGGIASAEPARSAPTRAAGYLLKDAPREQLVTAVRTVARGVALGDSGPIFAPAR